MKSPPKPTSKAKRLPAHLTPGNPGNSGGKKGKSGRKPFLSWCRDLLDEEGCRKQVEEILDDKTHPAFKAMWAAVADRAHGKPKETVRHEGEIKHGVIILPAITPR